MSSDMVKMTNNNTTEERRVKYNRRLLPGPGPGRNQKNLYL